MSPRQRPPSRMVCRRCDLPLQRNGPGWRHALNGKTKARSCGQVPIPVRRVDRPIVTGQWITMWRPVGTITIDGDEYAQRFMPGSFSYMVGKVKPILRHGRVIGEGLIVSAQVPANGSGVTLSIEVIRGEDVAA
jgi:hypothetical protein